MSDCCHKNHTWRKSGAREQTESGQLGVSYFTENIHT